MMRPDTIRRLAWLAAPLLLAGCGSRTDLTPPPGRTLPPAPFGTAARPTAEDLLDPPVQAVPQRNVELRRRSDERVVDPFDLPPES